MSDGEPVRGKITGQFITHRLWRKYTSGLSGPLGEVQAEYGQRELQDLEYIPLLRFPGGMLWGSRAEARLVNSNQSEDFVSSAGVLSKGRTRGRP